MRPRRLPPEVRFKDRQRAGYVGRLVPIARLGEGHGQRKIAGMVGAQGAMQDWALSCRTRPREVDTARSCRLLLRAGGHG
jgi:hypothetical protein